jgi:hypothetical protein
MKKDILNYEGAKIGELELPDDTSEEVWAAKLAVYAQPLAVAPIADVTPRQIRQAMVLSGVTMEQIDAAIASLPEPIKSLAHIEWEYSTLFIRSNPLVSQVGQMLGWNSAQLDGLWKLAATL